MPKLKAELTLAQSPVDEGELGRVRLRQHTQGDAHHLQVLRPGQGLPAQEKATHVRQVRRRDDEDANRRGLRGIHREPNHRPNRRLLCERQIGVLGPMLGMTKSF